MVSVPTSRLSGPSSNLGPCSIFRSRYVNHEKVRDMRVRSARREGGIRAAVGESQMIPRYISCCQSQTFPMYNVYSFLTVTFPSISRKVSSYLGQCMAPSLYKSWHSSISHYLYFFIQKLSSYTYCMYSTVRWSDFAIFEKLHVSADQVYF